MARVSMLDKEHVSGDLGKMFQKMEDGGNEVLNLFKVLANCPKVGRDFLRLGNSILFKGSVEPRLRELAILRTGDLAKATYEWTLHVPIG
ncbi:MAG: carboxymuconolactone decarboxylase family protein, partial [Deltaproteobacteria bacterium]|nr:carboxymuconolactone decarboxylase family protein [Deltaproteobacteria bacterium]